MTKSSQYYLNDHLAGRYKPEPFPYASPFTTYHEMMVSEYSPLVELDPSNGLSEVYRDTITVTGSGSVTESDGEFRVASGVTSGSTATLATKEHGRYQPGIMGMGGHSVRRPVAPTGDAEIWWEYGDGIDSVRVGEDSTGVYVQFISNNTPENKIYQEDWNRDTLTGDGGSSNQSGAQLDLTRQTTVRHPFSHYGVGPVQVVFYTVDANGYPQYILAHEFTGKSGQILWTDPKLPLREYVSNGTTGVDLELFVGGREFAVLGRYMPNRRKTRERFSNVTVGDGVRTPLASFKKKDLRKWGTRSCKVGGFSVSTNQDIFIDIVLGGTLTGDSFGSITDIAASETALESDTSATAITGGTAVDGYFAAGGVGSDRDLSGIDLLGVDIPADTVITLVGIGDGASATVSGVFKIEEEA